MWEARAAAGRLDDLVAAVRAAWPATAPGFAGGEVYAAAGPEQRVVAVTRWADGVEIPDLATDPSLHARPPHTWDFEVV